MAATRQGTSNFVSKRAAVRYYATQETEASYYLLRKLVDEKIADGSITIGRPQVKAGERIVTIDNDTRYAIELNN